MGTNKSDSNRPVLRRMIAVLAIAAAVVIAVILVKQMLPSPVLTTPSGDSIGRLPSSTDLSKVSLLLITLDTIRADRIGAYGFKEIATPSLDRLAREGVLFEQAVSAAPLTLPAHSSIFTGEYPPAHGVRDNGGFYLGEENVVLAEQLQAAGVRTGGFVGSFVLDAKWGVAQGFDTYFDNFDLRATANLSLGEIQRPASEVTDAALAWLDEAPEARFFSWVHFYDPHSPYEPPEPYASLYRDRPYVGEIAYVDSQIGRLIDWLDHNDRTDNTVVMVIGDHGESLGEHGESGHGFFVYDTATRVPFIVRTPFDSMSGHRVEAVVRAIDVMPTALELLNVRSSQPTTGVSLVPLLTGAERSLQLAAYSEAIYPRYHYGWSDLRALQAGGFKYIAAPRPELYDLSNDPGEETNLYLARTDLANRMHDQLTSLEEGWRNAGPAPVAEEVDPDTRAQLEALGYLGSIIATDPEPEERPSLADPKDKIHLYNLMLSAQEKSLTEGGNLEAIAALEQVVSEDPAVLDAWVRLGNEQLRGRLIDSAIGSFQRALELKPDYDLAVINLANAFMAKGEVDKAIVGYERFLDLDPRNAQIHYRLANILSEHGDYPAADNHFLEALELAPEMAAAKNGRAVIALHRSDPIAAEVLISEAQAIKPDVRLAHFNLALIAEARGDVDEAARLYREELELYPQSYKVEFNLGRLLASRGDHDGSIEALRRSIEINPDFAEGYFFLAKAYLDINQSLDEAEGLARTGLELEETSAMAPMGHYLLADIYARQGRRQDAERELNSARALENRG